MADRQFDIEQSQGTAIVVAARGQAVTIDAREHTLVMETPCFDLVELGASSPGVAAAAGLALDELEVEGGERRLGQAIVEILRRAAMQAEFGCPTDRFAERQVRWSPLAYAAPFLASRFLVDDLERFFPCRVALAHIEDDELESTTDAAEACVARMANWRALFSPTHAVGRPLSGTLAELGETASPQALWGLRHVPLTRRAMSSTHLEVLGSLGRHPRAAELVPIMRIVEDAPVDEITDALARIPRHLIGIPDAVPDEVALAELLALVEGLLPPKKRLAHLVDRAVEHAKQTCPRSRPTARPPIPLPDIAGVRFLATAGDVMDEGVLMGHCVATRAPLAVAGAAFLFHVELDGEAVTVQVNTLGRVVEARGVGNCEGFAALRASALLELWGRNFHDWRQPGAAEKAQHALGVASALHGRVWSRATEGFRELESPTDGVRTAAHGILSLVEDVLSRRQP